VLAFGGFCVTIRHTETIVTLRLDPARARGVFVSARARQTPPGNSYANAEVSGHLFSLGATMLNLFRLSMTLLGALMLIGACRVVQAQEPRIATITFHAPTKYVDGTDIAPCTVITYKLYQGSRGSEKARVADLDAAPVIVDTGLKPGETGWQVSAVANGVESDVSNEACKTFPWPATEPVVITVR